MAVCFLLLLLVGNRDLRSLGVGPWSLLTLQQQLLLPSQQLLYLLAYALILADSRVIRQADQLISRTLPHMLQFFLKLVLLPELLIEIEALRFFLRKAMGFQADLLPA